jgi:hypothetical protein
MSCPLCDETETIEEDRLADFLAQAQDWALRHRDINQDPQVVQA